MKWRQIAEDYFTFTRKDRIAILIIAGLLSFGIFIPAIFSNKHAPYSLSAKDTAWIAAIKKLEIKESGENFKNNSNEDDIASYQYDRSKNPSVPVNKELFSFDPNTLSENDWKRLGLRDKSIHTIQNFLNKGGHFYKPDDLKKIYGLHTDEFERLRPYIQIETKSKSAETEIISRESKPRFTTIDINSADTTAFIALPGIGNKLAARIVNFRDKLGGFYSVEQLKETYGLPDSTFQKIKPYLNLNTGDIRKININTATIDELKAHPYIKYNLANLIIVYRNEHGPFATIEDIKKIMTISDDIFIKISPYLSVQ